MKILVAEDDPVSGDLLKKLLGIWGYEVILSRDGKQTWKIISEADSPRLILLDLNMPYLDGLEICRRLRNDSYVNRNGYTYIIVLTARGRSEDVIEGLDAGADDYITKPYNPEELRYRIRIGERILNMESNLKDLSAMDSMTGVLSRHKFIQRLEEELNRSFRNNEQLGVIIADIDNFKKVNEQYGHQFGDQVIRDFARCLADNCRPYDFVGRMGAEEFITCVPETTVEEAFSIARRQRNAVNKLIVQPAEGGELAQITASFGIAVSEQGFQVKVDELVQQADALLRKAKEDGRDRIYTTDPDIKEP
ncbi:MAG: diguanylate cyclase [Chloroflexi bacterium]|nr:diguanylate cyclase [Chloroflexota bacterium]